MIGTTSTEEKAALAKKAGASEVILYGKDSGVDVMQEVYKITGGEGIDRGVHAVFDGVGKDTFDMDFDLVRRCVAFAMRWGRELELTLLRTRRLQEGYHRHPRQRLWPRAAVRASQARPQELEGWVHG